MANMFITPVLHNRSLQSSYSLVSLFTEEPIKRCKIRHLHTFSLFRKSLKSNNCIDTYNIYLYFFSSIIINL